MAQWLKDLAPSIGGLAGGLFEMGANRKDIGAVSSNIDSAFAMNPQNMMGPLGGATFGSQGGQFMFNPQMMAQLNQMGALGLAGLQGQGPQMALFNQANIQGSPEFMQQQAALGQGFNPDLDVQGIVDDRLAAMRAQAQPFEQKAYNRHRDVQQATGAVGHTGGFEQTEAFARGLGQADQQRILDSQQFGANLQSQLFGQALQGQQQNMSQGQQRIANLINMLSIGSNATAQDTALSQGLFGQQLGAQSYSTDALLGGYAADSARRNSQAEVINSQLGLLNAQGASNANMGGGIGSLVSAGIGLFSDIRLKQDIELSGTIGGVNFYTFRWKPAAAHLNRNLVGRDFGVIAQEIEEMYPDLVEMDERSGYLKVDYDGLQEIINGE